MIPATPEPRVAVLIPARLESSRFPGKVLADIDGRSLLQWVYAAADSADGIDSVFIVSGNTEILSHCERYEMQCIESRKIHSTGTDRIAEAATSCPHTHFVNVQADEPSIQPNAISHLASKLVESHADMVTLGHPLTELSALDDANRVKIKMDANGHAIDFYRTSHLGTQCKTPWLHIGIYGFTRQRLCDFSALPATQRSTDLGLEQLRALDAGWVISVVETQWRSAGVDTPADLERARDLLRERQMGT